MSAPAVACIYCGREILTLADRDEPCPRKRDPVPAPQHAITYAQFRALAAAEHKLLMAGEYATLATLHSEENDARTAQHTDPAPPPHPELSALRECSSIEPLSDAPGAAQA